MTIMEKLTPEEEAIFEAIYKALGEYNHAKRLAHDLRMIQRGTGPTIKRGTGRGALAAHLMRAVSTALHDPDDDRTTAAACSHSIVRQPGQDETPRTGEASS